MLEGEVTAEPKSPRTGVRDCAAKVTHILSTVLWRLYTDRTYPIEQPRLYYWTH
jgi:hypothetical protein